MAKNNRISKWRDHDLTVIENFFRRKQDRRTPQRAHPLDEPFYGWRGTEFSVVPNTGIITSILSNSNRIYQAGLRAQGGSSVNLGVFRGAAGTDGGDVYRVENDLEGLTLTNTVRLMPHDAGAFSIWVKGYNGGSGSGKEHENVLVIGQINDEATPAFEPSLVIRFEKDFAATTEEGDTLKLYPDLTNYPDDYIVIDIDEADWQVETWTKLTATWNYQTQSWDLTFGTTKGKRTNTSVIPHPEWGEFTQVHIFADQNGYDNIYHDCQWLYFGPSGAGQDSTGISPINYVIDTSSGIATSYGTLGGAVDGKNAKHYVSNNSYEPGTTQVYWNMRGMTRGIDYTESDASIGEITFMTARPDGTNVTVSSHKNDGPVDIRVATTRGGTDKLQIAGLLNGVNKVFKLPFPYVPGTLKVFWQGLFQPNGSDMNVVESDPDDAEFTVATAPYADDDLMAIFVPATAGRHYENTDNTLTFTFNGTNTRGTTSFPYEPCSLEISINGQLLTPGNGLIETDPANRIFDTELAYPSGSYAAAAFTIGSNADSVRNPVTGSVVKTANYTMTIYDKSVKGNATSGAITITLPTAADVTGMEFNVIKIDSSVNGVTIGATVNGVVNPVIVTQYDSYTMKSDGTEYYLI